MHLFALLLATVFSSQFVAPNTGITGVTINSGGTVTTTHLEGSLPAISITVAGTPTGALVWKLALDEAGTVGAVTITTQVEPDSTNFLFTHVHGDIALTDLLAQGIPDKFYLVVVDGAVTKAAKITVTALFTLGKQEIIEYETLEDVTFTITHAAWAAGTVYYAICSKAPQKDTDFATAITKTETADSGEITAKIPKDKAAALIAGMVDGNIYVYAGLTNAANAAKNAPVPIAVKVPAFTTDKTTLPCILVKTPAAVTLVLTEKAETPTWAAGGTLNVKVGKVAAGTTVTDIDQITIATGSAGVATLPITLANWTNIAFDSQKEKLYIWAKFNAQPSPTTETPAVVTFDAFAIDVPSVSEVAVGLGPLKVTAGKSAWDTATNVSLKFSHAPLADKSAAGFFQTEQIAQGADTAAGTYTLATLNLAGEPLAKGGKIYVYVGLKVASAFEFTFEPQTIEVTGATFTVTSDPANVKDSAETLSGTIVLTPAITDSVQDDTPDEISVYISLDPDAIPSARKLLGKAAVDDSVATTYKFEDLDIPEGIVLREDQPIQVWVSFLKKDGATGTAFVLSDKKTIPVVFDPAALRFKVDPEAIAVNELATLPGVDIIQTVGKPWAGQIKVQMTYEGAAAHTASDAITAVDGVYTYEWAAAEKTYLAAAAAGKKLTFKVDSGNNGSYLTEGVVITLGAAAVESTFDLVTKQLPWAADIKTTKIEITPLPKDSHKWPVGEDEVKVKFAVPAASESNTDPDPKIITVVVEGEEGEEKWYIPADEDLSAFVPEEAPEADILLEVTASIDGGDSYLKHKVTFTIKKPEPEEPEAAMGVSPLLSLFAALVFLFVKLL